MYLRRTCCKPKFKLHQKILNNTHHLNSRGYRIDWYDYEVRTFQINAKHGDGIELRAYTGPKNIFAETDQSNHKFRAAAMRNLSEAGK